MVNLSGKLIYVIKYKFVYSFLIKWFCRVVWEKISCKKDLCFLNVFSRVCFD